MFTGINYLQDNLRFKIFYCCYRVIFESVDDKNPWDEKGWTPLHHAAEMGNLEVCKFILENVSDKNPTNDYNETPVDMAREHGRIEVLQLFKEYGINSIDFTGLIEANWVYYDGSDRGTYLEFHSITPTYPYLTSGP